MSESLPVPAGEKRALEAQRREQAGAALAAVRSLLAVPAYEHHLGVQMLSKITTDPTAPVRERRRAAEVLAASEVKLLELQAALAGARDLALSDLNAHPAQLRATAAVAVNVQTDSGVRFDRAWWDEWTRSRDGIAWSQAQLGAVMNGYTMQELVEAGRKAMEVRGGVVDVIPMSPGSEP